MLPFRTHHYRAKDNPFGPAVFINRPDLGKVRIASFINISYVAIIKRIFVHG